MKDAFPSPIKVANAQQYTFVTLIVPRKKLRVFERLSGAPGIHLDIGKGKNNNLFFSIDCFFRRIKKNMDGSWGKVTEDESGWAGSSDLIVTTPVPSQLLENGDWDAALLVTMSIHCAFYMETLGPELCIYVTSSTDKRHLHTSNFPAGISQERFQPDPNRDMAALSLEQDRPVVISASQSKGPLVLQAKYTIEKDSEEAILLGKGAFVTLADITPCSILLKIGENHRRHIVFPYPIDGDKAKTRIARKSLWIEVTVPAASALVSGGYDSQPFPIIINEDKQPSSWSLPRIDLSKQPAISSTDPDAWLADTFDQFVSVREKKLIDLENPRH
jgi:hypothetical protein